MARPSLKEQILQAGLKVMFRKGYNGAGVREIVAEAGAPQGSFTNHFPSKSAFASAVLERYFEHVRSLVAQALDNPGRSPRDRLRDYLNLITDRLIADNCERGCLIGDFSLEAVPHDETLRQQLDAIFVAWRAPFAACIADGQRQGEIRSDFDAGELAEFLLASWQGAILRMKVERSPRALERFKSIAFATVFGAAS